MARLSPVVHRSYQTGLNGIELPSGPKLRVICDGKEERFQTEQAAQERADELRRQGRRVCHCSY